MWQNVSKSIAKRFYFCAKIRREQSIQCGGNYLLGNTSKREVLQDQFHGIVLSFFVLILRSPYGLVRDANEMLMTWSAKRLENVLKTLRYSNEFMLYNYYGNTSLYPQALCAILSSVGTCCCFLNSRYFVSFRKQKVYDC